MNGEVGRVEITEEHIVLIRQLIIFDLWDWDRMMSEPITPEEVSEVLGRDIDDRMRQTVGELAAVINYVLGVAVHPAREMEWVGTIVPVPLRANQAMKGTP